MENTVPKFKNEHISSDFPVEKSGYEAEVISNERQKIGINFWVFITHSTTKVCYNLQAKLHIVLKTSAEKSEFRHAFKYTLDSIKNKSCGLLSFYDPASDLANSSVPKFGSLEKQKTEEIDIQTPCDEPKVELKSGCLRRRNMIEMKKIRRVNKNQIGPGRLYLNQLGHQGRR